MEGVLEFPPVACELEDARFLIEDLFNCAKALGARTILQIGGTTVMVKPDEDPDSIFDRFRKETELHGRSSCNRSKVDTIAWISERRSGLERRAIYVASIPERRNGLERRVLS